jgi:hypothetical protein
MILQLLQPGILTVSDENCQKWLRLLPLPKARALSEDNCFIVKKALSECEDGCGCDPLRTLEFKPTRLLDLRAWEGNDSITLVDTSSLSERSVLRYAALSYCWESVSDAASQLKTTVATIASHMDHIRGESLTPVIRDAVKATRALSLDFLWIDALCTIQGDDQDWTRESGRMDSIYINSYCTICATASSTCLDGFLERKPPIVVGFESSLRRDIVGHLNFRYVCSSGKAGIAFNPILREREAGAWSSRGWTYQEECLSARKLFFGPTRMFYICPKRAWTETSIWKVSSSLMPTLAAMMSRYESTTNSSISWINGCSSWNSTMIVSSPSDPMFSQPSLGWPKS